MIVVSCQIASLSSSISTAAGCFIIAHHCDSETTPLYRAAYRTQPSYEIITVLEIDGIKSIHVYEIDGNLLPVRYAAITEFFQVKGKININSEEL